MPHGLDYSAEVIVIETKPNSLLPERVIVYSVPPASSMAVVLTVVPVKSDLLPCFPAEAAIAIFPADVSPLFTSSSLASVFALKYPITIEYLSAVVPGVVKLMVEED